jgi:hypothetical protein
MSASGIRSGESVLMSPPSGSCPYRALKTALHFGSISHEKTRLKPAASNASSKPPTPVKNDA